MRLKGWFIILFNDSCSFVTWSFKICAFICDYWLAFSLGFIICSLFQDITQQHLCDESSVDLIEKCTRFVTFSRLVSSSSLFKLNVIWRYSLFLFKCDRVFIYTTGNEFFSLTHFNIHFYILDSILFVLITFVRKILMFSTQR